MPIWSFYKGLSIAAFTLWLLSLFLSGPMPAIKMNHWIYESVHAVWWIKQDIDEDLDVEAKDSNSTLGPRYR